MKRIAFWSLGLAVLSLTVFSGCMRPLKDGHEVATGPGGTFTVLQPITLPEGGHGLGAYGNFALGDISDPYNLAPVGFKSGLAMSIRAELVEKKVPTDTSRRTALVNVLVLYYEDATLVGQAFGPQEEVVARVELVDKGTKKVLGVANCVGRTSTPLMQGVNKKAEGLAEGIVSWIEKNRPPKEH